MVPGLKPNALPDRGLLPLGVQHTNTQIKAVAGPQGGGAIPEHRRSELCRTDGRAPYTMESPWQAVGLGNGGRQNYLEVRGVLEW